MATKKKNKVPVETDSAYFLKIVLYFFLGLVWLQSPPIPVGFILGLLFASHDRFRIDRKQEYVVLLVATVLALMTGLGLFIPPIQFN